MVHMLDEKKQDIVKFDHSHLGADSRSQAGTH